MDSFIVKFWSSIFGGLRWLSFFQFARYLFPQCFRTPGATDAWVLANFALSAGLLAIAFAPGVTWWEWLLLVYGAVRVFEIFIYQANVVFFDAYRTGQEYAVHGFRRIVILSLHSYVEVFFWFALFYRNANDWFSKPDIVNSFDGALYLSMVTMATLGYGDIIPVEDHSGGRLLVTVHMGISIFLTLVVLARLISYLPQPRTLNADERERKTT